MILRLSKKTTRSQRGPALSILLALLAVAAPTFAQSPDASRSEVHVSAPLGASANTERSTAESVPAPTAPSASECSDALAAAKVLRSVAQLVEAREETKICSNPACPVDTLDECVRSATELDSMIPSVAFDVRLGGQQITDASVFADGRPIRRWKKGTALPLNPGEHVFHFDLPQHAPITQKVTLGAGERYRMIHADFVTVSAPATPGVETPSPPPPTPPRVVQVHFERPVPTIVYPLLGVGTLGVLAFTGLGVVGQLEQRNLEKSCAPRCTDEDKSSMRKLYLMADLSLGIGVVALIGASVLYLGRPESTSAPRVGVTLLPGGGAATLNLTRF